MSDRHTVEALLMDRCRQENFVINHQLLSKSVIKQCLSQLPASYAPEIKSNVKYLELGNILIKIFAKRCAYLTGKGALQSVIDVVHSHATNYIVDYHITFGHAIKDLLRFEFGNQVFDALVYPNESRWVVKDRRQREQALENLTLETESYFNTISEEWPQIPTATQTMLCMESYRKATSIKVPETCACCFRSRVNALLHSFPCLPENSQELVRRLHLYILMATTPAIKRDFNHNDENLNGLMLDQSGFCTRENGKHMLICNDCLSSLQNKKIPRFSLANNLYIGRLPQEFTDMTWVEEMMCCIHMSCIYVTRLYGSSDPRNSRVCKGNTCAFDMNVASTATILPRTPADVNGNLSIVFIGPEKYKLDCLKQVFKVRKKKVWRFLLWLKTNGNPLYQSISLSWENMNLYENGDSGELIPNIESQVIVDSESDAEASWNKETAGLDPHPADVIQITDFSESPILFLEKMGVTDPENVRLKGETFTSSALRNLFRSPTNMPDLVIHHGRGPVGDYHNPTLFPGMYPTLFPLGIGGFEDPERPIAISFANHANYLLDRSDRSFRYHPSYMFVVHNIIQKRAGHLYTALTVKSSRFERVAAVLNSIKADTVLEVANLIEKGSDIPFTNEQKKVFDLLREVNTIASKLPGSQASKLTCRNEIRSYTAWFGIPVLYFTANPNAVHSPMFQIFYGDGSVNLDDRFPALVDANKRSLRVAKDPVAAADFFQFSIKALLDHLLGWDFSLQRSKREGGIVGHLKAYYGLPECTERGGLHAHFLLWLLGALNPSDLHQRLKEDKTFEKRVCDFFDNIIWHHVPHIEYDIDPTCEPRSERPPRVPSSEPPSTCSLTECDPTLCQNPNNELPLPLQPTFIEPDWESTFAFEIKKCAEHLQRHSCRDVCHKYGNDDYCRFQFPHDLVTKSYFDAKTNSLILACTDSTVNYFNPIILVFARHNHDLKCILSGKSAKAAMFYITDYITKMELKTHQVLSLLSKAVAKTDEIVNNNSLNTPQNAKTLLHKCLSQLTKQTQIHAQQAARSLRGHGDHISSHITAPMMSSLLLHNVRLKHDPLYQFIATPEANLESLVSNDDAEPEHMRLKLGEDGKVDQSTQFHDYYYRSVDLTDVSYYEFVQKYQLHSIRVPKTLSEDNIAEDGARPHAASFDLLPDHPKHRSHKIVQMHGGSKSMKIPRVVGLSIPKKNADDYAIFALSHLKPFGLHNPLVGPHSSIQMVFNSTKFSDNAVQIMKNWEAIHECEDERDAERIKKKEAALRGSQNLNHLLEATVDINVGMLDIDYGSQLTMSVQSLKVNAFIEDLNQCHYFATPDLPPLENSGFNNYDFGKAHIKLWKAQVKAQEMKITTNRRNLQDQGNQTSLQLSSHIADTEQQTDMDTSHTASLIENIAPPLTESTNSQLGTSDVKTNEEMLNSIAESAGLNKKQQIAFRLIANAFFKLRENIRLGFTPEQIEFSPSPVVYLSGPGGTGKTYVINCVKKLMTLFGSEHNMTMVAPSGSAASNINGSTVHSAFKIKVVEKKNKTNKMVAVSPTDRKTLEDRYRHTMVVFVDEVSMLSQKLLAEIDNALRIATGNLNTPFGGVIIVFAGDFCQYPPVAADPLYKPIGANQTKNGVNDSEFMRRLGRLAWKRVTDVVILEEQQRMKGDSEFAEAVSRLRVRKCTQKDVDLFNSRVIKSSKNPDGVDMSQGNLKNAVAIVSTNSVRQAINVSKAISNCSESPNSMITCSAEDVVKGKLLTPEIRSQLLHRDVSSQISDGALPGVLKLYIGMPIILRHKNYHTDLGIVNGAQGILRHVETTNKDSLRFPLLAVVEFPDSIVKLEGLPDKYFVFEPMKWQYNIKISFEGGPMEQVSVVRWQFPFEAAFSLTGHNAQGKTMPQIHAQLHEGGFAAYVAVSRATCRYGLTIHRPVDLETLNRFLPVPLQVEMKRHEQMERNTLRRLGLMVGPMEPVFDPEAEVHACDNLSLQIVFTEVRRNKRLHQDSGATNTSPKKRAKVQITALADRGFSPQRMDVDDSE